MQPFKTRRDEARFLNRLIDSTLLEATMQRRDELLSVARQWDTQQLAERVRQRATRLGRHEPGRTQQLLTRRDELITALYATVSPPGWANGWCDGSSSRQASALHAGIGVLLLDASGTCISQTGRYVGAKTAFDAEVTALTAVLDLALAYNIERLRVHTDSKALVQLWHEQRDDPRLEAIRLRGVRFKALQFRAIPRLHNQVANALAKRARVDRPYS